MRDVLRALLPAKEARPAHDRFRTHWTNRRQVSLEWYHAWLLEPDAAVDQWTEAHANALRSLQIAEARSLLTWWADAALDDGDRAAMGGEVWARTHGTLANALCQTPAAARLDALTTASGHYRAALEVYTWEAFPQQWAMTQNNLGLAYRNLPTGDQGRNLQQAIDAFQAALEVYTREGAPFYYALAQENLGDALGLLFNETGDTARLGAARNAYATAAECFASVGMHDRAAQAEEGVEEIDGRLVQFAEGEAAEPE